MQFYFFETLFLVRNDDIIAVQKRQTFILNTSKLSVVETNENANNAFRSDIVKREAEKESVFFILSSDEEENSLNDAPSSSYAANNEVRTKIAKRQATKSLPMAAKRQKLVVTNQFISII